MFTGGMRQQERHFPQIAYTKALLRSTYSGGNEEHIIRTEAKRKSRRILIWPYRIAV